MNFANQREYTGSPKYVDRAKPRSEDFNQWRTAMTGLIAAQLQAALLAEGWLYIGDFDRKYFEDVLGDLISDATHDIHTRLETE